jgi:GNAT superfamily N-acetyltransferase
MRLEITTAGAADREWVGLAVRELLREISGDPHRELVNFPQVYPEIIDPRNGGGFIARDGRQEIGMVTYSRRAAVRTGGTYFMIEELWVAPAARSSGAGAALIEAVVDRATRNNVSVLEVGLPPFMYENLEKVEEFYRKLGFTTLGPRFRRALRVKESR